MLPKNNNTSTQNGSSLLETMVSLFVLAIGLLGTLAMQNKSIQHNQNSFSYSQAIVLANDLSEQLKVASDKKTAKDEWAKNIKNILPGGTATIVPNDATAGVQTVTIKFAQSAAAGAILEKENERDIIFKIWL
ncbi:MAG: hypothetical protein RL497_173 [Pseudomonadota bacterium]